MELFTSNVTFGIWLDNFWFEQNAFFYNLIFILANERKQIIIEFTKKTLFYVSWIFWAKNSSWTTL